MVVAVLLWPAYARAQGTAAIADLSLEELASAHVETVVGVSKYRQRVTRAPASVTIVTAAEIRAHNYRSLAEVLTAVSGFYGTYDRNYDFVGTRGFLQHGDYNSRMLVTVDGHRLNDAIFGGVLLGPEFPVDLEDIERVEVIRGPGSALYGSGALFAVINVMTKHGRDDATGEVSTVLGAQRTRGLRGSVTRTVKSVQVYGSVTGFSSRGANDLFYSEYASDGGHAYGLDGTKRGNALVNASAGHFKAQVVAGLREKQIPTGAFDTLFGDPRTQSQDLQSYGDLMYERSWADTAFVGRAAFDWYRYAGVAAYRPDETEGTSIVNDDSATARTASFEARVSRPVTGGHRITAGVEYRDNLDVHQKNFDREPYELYLDDHQSLHYWSVYGEDEWRPARIIGIQAGARVDRYPEFGLQMEPRVALILNPAVRRAIKVMYTGAFKAPTIYQQYWLQTGVSKANPKLAPESITSAEVAYEEYFNTQWRMSVNVFSYRLHDLIAQSTDPVDGLLVYRNLGEAASTGTEFEIDGRTSSGYRFTASQTLQRSRDVATGARLSNSPTALWKASGSVPLRFSGATAIVDLQAMSSRLSPTGFRVRGRAVANLTVTAPIHRQSLLLTATMFNAFDTRYSDPGSKEHRQAAIEQNGRTFLVRLTAGF